MQLKTNWKRNNIFGHDNNIIYFYIFFYYYYYYIFNIIYIPISFTYSNTIVLDGYNVRYTMDKL